MPVNKKPRKPRKNTTSAPPAEPTRYAYRHRNDFGVSPQAVGEALSTLEAQKGRVEPADVVELARPADSPLHDAFIWDDTQAAKLYRERRASQLVRSVRVLYDTPSQPPVAAFVSVVHLDTSRRAYVSTDTAMRTTTYRDHVISEARKQMREMIARYQHLSEFSDAITAMKQAVAG